MTTETSLDLSIDSETPSESVDPLYGSVPGYSFHQLINLYRSKEAFLAGLGPYTQAKGGSLALGTLIHEFLLKPETISRYVTIPEHIRDVPTTDQQNAVISRVLGRLSEGFSLQDPDIWGDAYAKEYKTGKAIDFMAKYLPWAEFSNDMSLRGVTHIPAADWNVLQRISQKAVSDSQICLILGDTQAVIETPVITTIADLPLKGKPDWYRIEPERNLIRVNDPKSSSKPITSFAYECRKYDYPLQLMHYAVLILGHMPSAEQASSMFELSHIYAGTEGFNHVQYVPYRLDQQACQILLDALSELYKAASVVNDPSIPDHAFLPRPSYKVDWVNTPSDSISGMTVPSYLVVRPDER